MRNHTRNNRLYVSKFDVCTGVFSDDDVHLLGEVIGTRWQQNRAMFSQSWTADSWVRAADQSKRNAANRTDLVHMDIVILQFVLEEITNNYPQVKRSERFDVACSLLRSVVAHVRLGRTDARKRVRELLETRVDIKVRGKVNPSAVAACTVPAINSFIAQTNFDRLSKKSLDNMLQVALVFEEQIASYIEYLGYCVNHNVEPRRGFLNAVYQNINVKPYSYALNYVRFQKAKKHMSADDELFLLYELLEVEYRLSLASKAAGELKRSKDKKDPTLQRIVESAIFDRYHYPIYESLHRELGKIWGGYVKCCDDTANQPLATQALEDLQKAIRYRALSPSRHNSHPWAPKILEETPLPEYLGKTTDPFKGLPNN